MFKPSLWRRQHGFTLIEIMVSMVLVGILVVGLSGVWTMVGEQFFRITLRQKAVFVLHGQMERIAMMYRTGKYTDTVVTNVTDGYDTTPAHSSETHWVFIDDDPTNTSDADDDPTNTSDADELIVTQDEFDSELGGIYYMDIVPLGASSEDRNVVWLDKEKKVTAVISWTLTDSDNPVTGDDCYQVDTWDKACQLLTLYLDYPYRYSDGGQSSMLGTAKTITLKTIVGRYQ